MTKVQIKKVNGVVKSVSMEDHANAAPYGQDLICNSITVATQILLMGVTGVLELEPDVFEFDPTKPTVKLVLSDYQALKCIDLTNTFAMYLELFAKQYSNYLQVEVTNE